MNKMIHKKDWLEEAGEEEKENTEKWIKGDGRLQAQLHLKGKRFGSNATFLFLQKKTVYYRRFPTDWLKRKWVVNVYVG
jgi:hypothetical protein